MTWLKKFPSYENLLRSVGSTVRRFPLALISASLGALLGVYLIGLDKITADEKVLRLVMTAALGLPLFIALKILGEKRRWPSRTTFLVQGSGVILAAAYYYFLIRIPTLSEQDAVRFLLLNIGLHFLVAFIAFVKGPEMTGFWQFNKVLFLRFVTVTLYASVMYIGLMLAMAAIDHLFGVDLNPKRYAQLWVIMAGIFHPWVFLAGFPVNLIELNNVTEYPKGLRIFSQYILLPLAALYFAILIAYETKIIVEWNWPKGLVSTMVLTYSATGILAMLLLHPLKDLTENRWVKAFIRRFFWGLVPLIVMLYLAIIQRVLDYGITPNRYLVMAMAAGLTVVVLYFIVSKLKDIRIIPIVLCVLAFLSAYGPQSAFSISERSQTGRLERMLTKHGLPVDGSLQKTGGAIPFEDLKEMSSIVAYLDEWHGRQVFSPWLADSVLKSMDSLSSYGRWSAIAAALGFTYVSTNMSSGHDGWFRLNRDTTQACDISGYNYLIHYKATGHGDDFKENPRSNFLVNSYTWTVEFDKDLLQLHVGLSNQQEDSDRLTLPLAEPLKTLIADRGDNETVSADQLTFGLTGVRFDARIVFNTLSGDKVSDSLRINYLDANIMIRKHPDR